MKLNSFPIPIATTLVLMLVLTPNPAQVQGQGTAATTAATVSAARAFLATLDETKRAKAVFAFGDDVQRKNWSNLPSGIYQRAGLRLGDLSKTQREAALAVLAAALSKPGYQKVLDIMEGDEALPRPKPAGTSFSAAMNSSFRCSARRR